MPRRQWNDGQEIIQGDLNSASPSLEIELYDRILYELMQKQQTFLFDGGLACTNVNSTTTQVALGSGFYFDNTQVDPEPQTRPVYRPANSNVTHTAADGTNNRIDIVVATPARATASTQSRNFKDAGTGVVSSQSMVVETDWLATLTVVAGTPAASPAVPATPAGTIKLAEILVTAVTGISGAGAYTDKRPRFGKLGAYRPRVAKTAAYTADLDDSYIICNANGGAFAVTLPSATLFSPAGFTRDLTIVKVDSSANAVTITAVGSDLIQGSATQTLDNQYDSMTLYSDGSAWYLK